MGFPRQESWIALSRCLLLIPANICIHLNVFDFLSPSQSRFYVIILFFYDSFLNICPFPPSSPMPITNPVHQHSLSACVDNTLALGAEKGTKLLVLGANLSESGMGGSLRLVCLYVSSFHSCNNLAPSSE